MVRLPFCCLNGGREREKAKSLRFSLNSEIIFIFKQSFVLGPILQKKRSNEEEVIFHLLVLEQKRFFGRSFILLLMGDNNR